MKRNCKFSLLRTNNTSFLLQQANLYFQGNLSLIYVYFIFAIRHGDIYSLSPIFATLYAIISKVQTYSFPPEEEPASRLSQTLNKEVMRATSEEIINTASFQATNTGTTPGGADMFEDDFNLMS